MKSPGLTPIREILRHARLRWWLIAAALPGLAALLFVPYLSYVKSREDIESQSLQTARALAQAVDRELFGVQVMLQSLAVSSEAQNTDLSGLHREARRVAEITGITNSIGLLDASGRLIFNTEYPLGEPLPRTGILDRVREVFATKKPLVSEAFVGALQGRPMISVNVPVLHGGEVTYDLAAVILSERLARILQFQELPAGWIAAIIDRRGAIVAHSDAQDTFAGMRVASDLWQRIEAAREGLFDSAGRGALGGVPSLTAYSRPEANGLTVAVSIPYKELLGAAWRSVALTTFGVVALMLAGLVAAWRLGGGILRSVDELTRAARGAESGRLSTFAWTRGGPRELHELQQQFNRMLGARRQIEDLLADRNRELEARNAEFADLYNRAPCGYHSLDKNGMIVAINDTELAMKGYTREELVGRVNYRELLTPEARGRFDEIMAGDFIHGKRIENLESLHVRKDGSLLPVLVTSELIRAADGKSFTTRATVVADTERRKVQDVLRLHAAILATLAEGVMLISEATRKILYVNPMLESMFGYGPGELIGEPAVNLMAATEKPARDISDELWRTRSSQPWWQAEVLNQRKDGTVFWTLTSVSTLAHPEFGPVRVVAKVDISRRKEIEEELERRVVERTAQVRRLAVEATLSAAREREVIARDLHDDLGQTLHVAKIRIGALAPMVSRHGKNTLSDLSSLITDASRVVRSLTTQLDPPVLATLGLAPAISWLGEEMERTYGLRVEFDSDPIPRSPTQAQSGILFRVARELLINVAKHAGTSSAQASLRVVTDKMILEVRDLGSGIPDQAKVLDGTKTYGLASVRERVIYLGGDMAIRSPSGGGTTVTVTVPLEPVPEPVPVPGVAA